MTYITELPRVERAPWKDRARRGLALLACVASNAHTASDFRAIYYAPTGTVERYCLSCGYCVDEVALEDFSRMNEILTRLLTV